MLGAKSGCGRGRLGCCPRGAGGAGRGGGVPSGCGDPEGPRPRSRVQAPGFAAWTRRERGAPGGYPFGAPARVPPALPPASARLPPAAWTPPPRVGRGRGPLALPSFLPSLPSGSPRSLKVGRGRRKPPPPPSRGEDPGNSCEPNGNSGCCVDRPLGLLARIPSPGQGVCGAPGAACEPRGETRTFY